MVREVADVTLEKATSTNAVIIDSVLGNYETPSEGGDISDMIDNKAIDITCGSTSDFDIWVTEDTLIVQERGYPSYPVDVLGIYLEDCVKMQNTSSRAGLYWKRLSNDGRTDGVNLQFGFHFSNATLVSKIFQI